MIISASMFVYGPIVLCLCALELLTALLVFHGSGNYRRLLRLGWIGVVTLAALGLGFAVLSGLYFSDWVHNFWAAQIPMVGLFLCSGLLLCRVWREDAALTADEGSGELEFLLARSRLARMVWSHPAWLFLASLIVLSLVPLALQIVFPASYSNPFSTGRPAWNLVELARWGLGGPVPGYLAELAGDGTVRAHQNVPREVTVPMGTTLIAAWLWIAFCGIALAGRLIPKLRLRVGAYLVAPLALLVLNFIGIPGGDRLALDPRYFGPNSARESGIWQDEGATLATYGDVLLLASILTVVLATGLVIDRILWRRRHAVSSSAILRVPASAQPEDDRPTRFSLRAGLAWLAGRSIA
jgi:hypothetical protein